MLGRIARGAGCAQRQREPELKHVLLSWSSGKDSAWTLHLLRQQPDIHVAALLTTFNSAAGRVAMHAVRRALVEAQADRTGIPLWAVELPWPCSNLDYEERMRAVCQQYASAFQNDAALHPVKYIEQNWSEDEWSGGCYVASFHPSP